MKTACGAWFLARRSARVDFASSRNPLLRGGNIVRAARVLCVLPAVLLLSAPFVKAQSANDPPTLFERWQERREKSPALEQKLLTAVDVMKKAAWMEGRWEVTEKVYKAGRIPELVAKGTRESRLDLDGRCLVSRQTVGSLKTIDTLISTTRTRRTGSGRS
ncbi:MAG: hypothetical protein IPN83_07610 [Holophagales bacterium]|jgi:hypothetical protein|nr:hypothetical protein [Holophagales bacterium]